MAIIPHVIKAGFVVAGSGGHGVVMSRVAGGKWGKPVFVNFGGGSVGFQAGVKSTDVVLVFSNRKSLDRILEGKGKITLGADAAVAAGPVGREARAGTDAKLEAEVLSYSRSRGLFGGVALDGSVIRPDANTNAEYLKDTRPEVAKQVDTLADVLNAMSGTTPPAPPVPGVCRPWYRRNRDRSDRHSDGNRSRRGDVPSPCFLRAIARFGRGSCSPRDVGTLLRCPPERVIPRQHRWPCQHRPINTHTTTTRSRCSNRSGGSTPRPRPRRRCPTPADTRPDKSGRPNSAGIGRSACSGAGHTGSDSLRGQN